MSNLNPPNEPSGSGCTEAGCGCLVLLVPGGVAISALWGFKRVWEWL